MNDNKFSLAHRILHWSLAIAILFLLLTILLRMGWMNKNHMADILKENLSEINIQISDDQAVVIAKKIRQPMWQWHIYTGYAIVVIYFLRGLLALFQGWLFTSPFERGLPLREKFQSWVYLIFYVLLGFSLTTGLLIEFGPENLEHTAEELHEKSMIYLVTYIILHFAGLIFAEISTDKGIISKMIGGK
jgi:cytochrome b561